MVRGSASAPSAVRALLERRDDSIKKALPSDPDSEASYPNRESRESFGFWVDVEPEPLPHPFLVSTSPDMLATLGLDASAAADAEFVSFFAGGSPPGGGRAWATPYAVSVFGQSIDAPDPFGRGNGYGDGRAATLGEFSLASGERWELQLKGSGTTPFSRGGDGRAVLRSSVREYLVSEAMHHMGVPTTRALSLVASATLFTRRAWCAAARNSSAQFSLSDAPPAAITGTPTTTRGARTRRTRSSRSAARSHAARRRRSCASATSSSTRDARCGRRRAPPRSSPSLCATRSAASSRRLMARRRSRRRRSRCSAPSRGGRRRR